MRIRITYIISSIDKALEFEQVAEKLGREKFELSFILMNPGGSALENFVDALGIPVYRVTYSGKKDLPLTVLKIMRLLRKIKPQIVHTHLFDASLAGLMAAKLAGVKRRISTRHHSDYHHTYFPHAVKYDRLNNRLSTEIIAISNVVKKVLVEKEQVPAKKIHIVHHGVITADFENVPDSTVKQLTEKYNPSQQRPVIGVISRYIKLKGIQFIIPAFQKVLGKHPTALLILANAKGSYAKEIRQQLSLLPEKNYREIDFEKDICALYRLFDIFVHVPTSESCEAFGQTYIEALAAGVPSVFTLSGIAADLIVHERNALVVPYKDSDAIFRAFERILEGRPEISEMIRNGKQDVAARFTVDRKIRTLEQIYLQHE
ncbi:MAG: glycosyltransferase family 4 protein [Bacteroidetes bacterium]|nr:glycosyltransferase family 4 protein [Bacteroidota bacterium]